MVAVIEGCFSKVSGFTHTVSQAVDFLQKHESNRLTVPTIVMRVIASHEEVSVLGQVHSQPAVAVRNSPISDARDEGHVTSFRLSEGSSKSLQKVLKNDGSTCHAIFPGGDA